ncbi:hypothetical protein JCGZ_09442 [Jatropha curcas]|uniref:Uncharacterized protein n=1 Tax=Jatropha curcas TaxID=180498 RepID=A0A067KJY2_JATCU|nr:hypothetical protein JCGZ_09442 [Jatropha curcas]
MTFMSSPLPPSSLLGSSNNNALVDVDGIVQTQLVSAHSDTRRRTQTLEHSRFVGELEDKVKAFSKERDAPLDSFLKLNARVEELLKQLRRMPSPFDFLIRIGLLLIKLILSKIWTRRRRKGPRQVTPWGHPGYFLGGGVGVLPTNELVVSVDPGSVGDITVSTTGEDQPTL